MTNKSSMLIQSLESLANLGQIPEPAIAFNHVQPSIGKIVGWRIPYKNRLTNRRKKSKRVKK